MSRGQRRPTRTPCAESRPACARYEDRGGMVEEQGWQPTQRRTRTSFPPHPVLVEYERDLRAL